MILDGKAKPFLFGIARRLVMAHWREAKTRNTLVNMNQQAADAAHSSDPEGRPPDADLLERERSQLLVDAVDQLPPRMAQVVRLIHFESRSPAEVAQALGISRKTVYDTHSRALIRLRSLLGANTVQTFSEPARDLEAEQ